MVDSILPPSSSDLEKRLDIAIAGALSIDIPISKLWNPYECPIKVLPYLAWALSVDQWSDYYSENRKRKIVANSLELHRIKGTRRALDLALSNIDLSISVMEWFEHNPPLQPGTFTIDVYSEDQPLTDDLLNQVKSSIESVKRNSAHYGGISLNLKSNAKIYFAAVCKVGETIKTYPRQVENINIDSTVFIGVGVRIQETLYIKPRV